MKTESVNLYDSLARSVSPLKPRDAGRVGIYCCGPTVYGPAHIGNFRTFIVQDVIRRVLELAGFTVCHVRNITDVDDKTIRQSQVEGVSLADFTRKWTEKLHRDCVALNLLPPHYEPSAVDHIPDQIALIQELEKKGLTYQGDDGSVYFRISSFPEYGKLSRVAFEHAREGARCGMHADEYDKESAADFALWKAQKPEDGDNSWDSPWGKGRPGWHIECSAMALRYLDNGFDIHAGGEDLLFPHHENEIAQSEGATGACFARCWMHVSHLMVDSQKMSKSLGNLYTVGDLVKLDYYPVEVRYTLLQSHYRKPLNFTLESLSSARATLKRFSTFLKHLEQQSGRPCPTYEEMVKRSHEQLPSEWLPKEVITSWQHVLQDVNVPAALGAFYPVIRSFFDKEANVGEAYDLQWVISFFILGVLGLDISRYAEDVAPEEVRKLAEERAMARSLKDWKAADLLRQQILDLGWEVEDAQKEWRLRKRT